MRRANELPVRRGARKDGAGHHAALNDYPDDEYLRPLAARRRSRSRRPIGALVSLACASGDAEENIVRMTGTDGQFGAQRVAHQSERESTLENDHVRRAE